MRDRLLGLELPRLARAVYPAGLPARRWLQHYATLFDTVEVNSTFYRLPSRDAVANWAKETPPHFVFAVKASRYLTHVKRLTDLGQGVERFYERIEPLIEAGKLGPGPLAAARQTSSAISSASARPSSSFRPGGTASSSATRAGSTQTSTPCCGATAVRS